MVQISIKSAEPRMNPRLEAPPHARIGDVLTSHGLITREQAEQIARHHLSAGLRFGEAAVDLGLISRTVLQLYLATLDNGRLIDDARFGTDIVMFGNSFETVDEFRALRNTLAVRWFNHEEGARTLAVVGPGRGDGRSFTVANLAVSFAMAGMQTLVVDGDMRNPRQHALFGVDPSKGLSDYLAGADLGQALHKIPGLSLVVMPAGTGPNPQELLSGPRLAEFAQEAGQVFDAVLFDTPAGQVYADYEMLSAVSKGALLVMQRNRTPLRQSKQIIARCGDYGVRVVGSLLVDGQGK